VILHEANPKFRESLGHYSGLISALFVEHIDLLFQMPDNFSLVILPVHEPELAHYALELAAQQKIPGQSVVYASVDLSSVTFLLPEGPLEVALPKLEN
jgi:hypothetical protein